MLFFIAILTVVTSCSDASFESKIVDVNDNVSAEENSSDSNKIDKPETEPNDRMEAGENENDTIDIDDDEQANPPGMISGAFLVRECVEKESTDTESVILCRVLDEQTKAKSSAQFEWNFTGKDEQTVSEDSIDISYLEAGDSWHIEIRTAIPIKVSVKLDNNDEQQIEESSPTIKGEDELLGPESTEEPPVEDPGPEVIIPTIAADFSGNAFDNTVWELYNTNVSFANDSLTCQKDSNLAPVISHSGLMSMTPTDYTGGSASIELIDLVSLNVIEAQAFIWGINLDPNNRAHFLVEGENLIARYMNAGAILNVSARAYNAASDKFFKISHDPNTNNLVYEVSADGINWSIFAQTASQWAVTNVLFEYHCGAWGNFSGRFSSTVDNISIYLPSISAP